MFVRNREERTLVLLQHEQHVLHQVLSLYVSASRLLDSTENNRFIAVNRKVQGLDFIGNSNDSLFSHTFAFLRNKM